MSEPKTDAPSYKVIAQTYLGRLYEPDDVIAFDGVPNAALEPLNPAAVAAVAAATTARAERETVFLASLSTIPNPPRTASLLPGQDFASMKRRAEEAEFTVAERDEEIVKLQAEVAALKDERAAKVPQPKESGGAK